MNWEKFEVAERFEKLAKESVLLNRQSDLMAAQFDRIDDVIKSLNIGVATWIEYSITGNGHRAIGYSRLKGKWGVTLRKKENEVVEIWHVNDAPRYMRLEATAHVPGLFDALHAQVIDMTVKISKAGAALTEFADEITKKIKGEYL